MLGPVHYREYEYCPSSSNIDIVKRLVDLHVRSDLYRKS